MTTESPAGDEPLTLRVHVDRFWRLYREEARKLGQKRNVHLTSSQIVRAAREARRRLNVEQGWTS